MFPKLSCIYIYIYFPWIPMNSLTSSYHFRPALADLVKPPRKNRCSPVRWSATFVSIILSPLAEPVSRVGSRCRRILPQNHGEHGELGWFIVGLTTWMIILWYINIMYIILCRRTMYDVLLMMDQQKSSETHSRSPFSLAVHRSSWGLWGAPFVASHRYREKIIRLDMYRCSHCWVATTNLF